MPEFIKKFFSFIKRTVNKIIPSVKSIVKIGIGVAQDIKDITDSPTMDFLVRLTKTIKDDAALQLAREYLPKLIAQLQFIDRELTEQEVNEYVIKISQMPDNDAKAILLHGIASGLNNHISPEIGSIGQSFITTEVVYKDQLA